ncbi:probable glutathione S-transferase [Gossypium raimondii]|uniref:probable glutathione S-transferase n=1 Tax=Gossypium raimondii TaxID=29730 RepID=UPI00227AD988|nr:probable glutathione S-transferase [Gossypium raimondii]
MDGQGNGKEVKLLGTWFSPYVQRVVWVLKLKGIDYEWVEQGFRDPKNRSQLLLKYNPVMKTVPVLVHHGRPVLESLIILEYIDETWKNNPILPSDPYERAMARFWENLIDQKITKILSKLLSSMDKKQMEEEMKQVSNTIEILDRELKAKGNKFFGGETINRDC